MKFQVKLKELIQQPDVVEKALVTKLKKPINHIMGTPGEKVPFCYEFNHFGEGRHFLSIGVAKELDKHWKQKRVKGQGLDENMKPTKIDKKKVAYGEVCVNDEGIFEFYVMGGLMKPMEAKAVMKSNTLLKNKIGANYTIIKGEGGTTEEEVVEDTGDLSEGPTPRGEETTQEETTQEETTQEETTDTTSETEGTTAPVDGKQIAAEFSKIDAAYKKIAAATDNAEKVKLALIVYKNIQTFRPQLEEYAAQASGKNKEQADKMLQVVNGYYTKLEPLASKVDQKQSEKSVGAMEEIFGTIGSTIDDLLSNALEEIGKIPELQKALEDIRK